MITNSFKGVVFMSLDYIRLMSLEMNLTGFTADTKRHYHYPVGEDFR